MAKRGPKRTSELRRLLRRREHLRQRLATTKAEMSGSLWPINQAIAANERAIKRERKRRREAKKAAASGNT